MLVIREFQVPFLKGHTKASRLWEGDIRRCQRVLNVRKCQSAIGAREADAEKGKCQGYLGDCESPSKGCAKVGLLNSTHISLQGNLDQSGIES